MGFKLETAFIRTWETSGKDKRDEMVAEEKTLSWGVLKVAFYRVYTPLRVLVSNCIAFTFTVTIIVDNVGDTTFLIL